MKIIFTFLAFIAFYLTAQSQTTSGPVMNLDITTNDYGIINQGDDPVRKFKFTNTGIEPLIIKSAISSQGRTVASYPQEPIMPGESNRIEIRYDTQRLGTFTQTVNLTTNETDDTHTLTITGEVK